MPYDDSEQRKTHDYLTGQAFGVGYNTDSSLGAGQYKSNFAPAPPLSLGQGTGRSGFRAEVEKTVILSKTERKALRQQQARLAARSADQSFAGLLFFAAMAAIAFLDYRYLPEMPWWAHVFVVLPVPILLVTVLDRHPKLLRRLRYTILTAVFLALAVGVVLYLDLVPAA